MAHYPKLKKKFGMTGAVCLIIWGAFILGMQLYVFGYYSRVYSEGTDGNWGDAYTGLVLANSAASLFFGLYYVVVFSDKPTTKMLLWGIILAVIGSFAAAGSTVLAALEADWVKTSANVDSTHPCRYSNSSETDPAVPTELICTNWFALEVTVAVLSGLAFSEYIFIAVVIFMGMSTAKSFMDQIADYQSPKSNDPIIPAARITPNNNNNNNTNNPQSRMGQEGPYNAFNNYSPPPSAKSVPPNQQYDDMNPHYSYHLQQLSLQQQQQQQQQQSKPPPKGHPTTSNYNNQPVREAPAVPSSNSMQGNDSQMYRGRLQVLHNQRQRAPAPPVPTKPNMVNNNSSLYRY